MPLLVLLGAIYHRQTLVLPESHRLPIEELKWDSGMDSIDIRTFDPHFAPAHSPRLRQALRQLSYPHPLIGPVTSPDTPVMVFLLPPPEEPGEVLLVTDGEAFFFVPEAVYRSLRREGE